jgi:16S rRNA (adenine1518-N6/adenine1519-N6)-dimethyltransferase
MVDRAAITPRERVLEIGAGKGALTKQLCKVSGDVEAFEVDAENFRVVKALELKGLTLHLGDAFSEPHSFDVLVSSLPYSESSTFVEWLAKLKYNRAVVLLQKDFVDKLTAVSGDDRYRAVSVISQISSSVEPLRTVGRSAFSPPPRVASVVALITPNRLLSAKEIGLIKLLFSQKKRRLGGVLKRLSLETADPTWRASRERVERLTSDEVVSILESVESSL